MNGKPVVFKGVNDAIKNGISIIFQEFNLMPELTVAENISISDLPQKGITIDKKKMIKRAQDLFDSIGIKLDPNMQIVGENKNKAEAKKMKSGDAQ